MELVKTANKSRLKEILDADNVADLLDKSELTAIGRRVVDTFEKDDDSEERRRKKIIWKNGQKALTQELKADPDGPQIKYPLLATASIQFASRAMPELVPNQTVAKPKFIGEMTPEKAQQGRAVCDYQNWQLFNEIEEWEEDTDRLLNMLPGYGCMFREVYASKSKGRICTGIFTPEEIVVPEKTKTIGGASRIGRVFYLPPREIVSKTQSGEYVQLETSFDDEKSEQEEEFIQQFTYEDLDEDGFKEPYLVVVHRDSGEVVRIQPNYRIEGIHKNDNGQVRRIDPIKYYVKYKFIPALDGGFYDTGFFDLLYPINEAVNEILNQLVMAGQLANSNSGFISKQLASKARGKMNFKVGQYNVVDGGGMSLREHIMRMEYRGADPVLFQLLGFIIEAGRDVAQLKEVLEGTSAATATAYTTKALIEQGLKVFSGIYKRIHKALGEELEIMRDWTSYGVNPMYEEVLDLPDGVKPEWFSGKDFNFVPVSDPQVVTDMMKAAISQQLSEAKGDPYYDQQKVRSEIHELGGLIDYEQVKAGQNPETQKLQQQMQEFQKQAQKQMQALAEKNKQLETKLADKTQDNQLKANDQKLKEIQAQVDESHKQIESKMSALVDLTTALKNVAEAESKEPGTQIKDADLIYDELTKKLVNAG